jgi:purine-nucleoside phosphorylase
MAATEACATAADRAALAAATIRRHWSCPPATAIILGTGLGPLADEIVAEAAIPYREIPGFPCSTALAHKGRLVCGTLAGAHVIALQGRCHCYEGYAAAEVTLPVRTLAALGVKNLIVTNAAGGLNSNFAMGDVMLIEDHINLMGPGSWPLASCSPSSTPAPCFRFYDAEFAAQAEKIARRADFPLRRGIYVAVVGPSYETRAEYRAFRRIGGDCVGMSTVPEVLAAASCGMRVLGLSTVTNVACPDAPQKVTAQEVVDVAATALPKVRRIIEGLLTSTEPL